MPDIDLLEPETLRTTVQLLQTPENLFLSSRLPKTPNPFPTVTWDVIRGSRMVGRPNVPNAEAHIVPRLGIAQKAAAFMYYREKKVFGATTLHWLRSPGSVDNLRRAEEAVSREVADLNQRCDNLVEWACWQALTGRLVYQGPDVRADVDYMLPTSHKPNPLADWRAATPDQLVLDVQAWKRLINRDGRVGAREAFGTEPTLNYILRAFARSNLNLLSDRMKEAYYNTGSMPGFLGLDWTVVESQYDTDSGDTALFLPDNSLFIVNLDDQRPMELYEGPTADDDAPDGFTGKFSKSWKEPDPSARQILLEYHFLPVITRPEQIVYVPNVTSPTG